MSLSDLRSCGELVYSLPDRYPSIQRSTLVLAPIGQTLAKLEGQVSFEGDIVLDVWELVDFNKERIRHYSFVVRRRTSLGGGAGGGCGWGGRLGYRLES